MEMAQVALGILLVQNRYVMQLRDDSPDISSPGMWSLFGGTVETGESPLDALVREVQEELAIAPIECRFLFQTDCFVPFSGCIVKHWFFESDVTREWPARRLMEGRAAQHFAYDELITTSIPPVVREALKRHHAGSG